MTTAVRKHSMSFWLYPLVFGVGVVPPFLGPLGQLIGIAFLVLISVRLFLIAIKRKQHTYEFIFWVGLLASGQIYFRDFAFRNLSGYLLIEYIFIMLGILNFRLILKIFATRRFGRWLWPYLFFCFWAFLSLAYSIDPLKGRWFISLYFSGLSVITFVLCSDKEELQKGLLDGLILGSVLVLGVTLSFYIQTPQYFLERSQFRFGHYLTSAVQLGTVLSMGGMLWFWRHFYDKWHRHPGVLVAFCLMGASVITMSRTSSFALLLSLAVLCFWKQSFKKMVIAMVSLSLIVVGLAIFTLSYQPDVAQARFLEPTSDQARFDIWRVSLEMAKDEPIGGFGVGAWSQVYPKYAFNYGGVHPSISDAHNIFVQALVECGVVGFVLLAIFFVVLLILALRSTNGLSLSVFVFVFAVAMSGSLKLVAPYVLIGLIISFSCFERDIRYDVRI